MPALISQLKPLNFFENQEPEYLSDSPHSCPRVRCAKKLLRKKKNESRGPCGSAKQVRLSKDGGKLVMWKQNCCGLWLAGICLTLAPIISRAQEPSPTASPVEARAEEII